MTVHSTAGPPTGVTVAGTPEDGERRIEVGAGVGHQRAAPGVNVKLTAVGAPTTLTGTTTGFTASDGLTSVVSSVAET